MFLYVLVELEFAYDTFLHHHQWLKTIQCDGVNVTFLIFVFVILWHGLGRRAEE